MRVLHFVHGFPPECRGGTETYLPRLLHGLVAEGHDVAVVTGSQVAWPRAGIERADFEGLRVWKLHRSGLYLDAWDRTLAPEIEPLVASVIAEFRPDVAHVHHWLRLSRTLAGFVQSKGVPAVLTLHDLTVTCPRLFRVRDGTFCERPLSAASCQACVPLVFEVSENETAQAIELYRDDFAEELELAAAVIAPTASLHDRVLQQQPSLAGRIRMIPFAAVETEPLKSKRPPPAQRLRIGHWGNLTFLKGIDLILDAATRLEARDRERMELHVFGNIVFPAERPRIEELARGSNTTLHGTYTIQQLIDAPLDLAVFASRCSETYGYVLDEAFRLGLPAVVPARGALGERVAGGGATFRPEDSRDLARVLSEVINDRDGLERWRNAIPRLMPFARHVQLILGVYEDVLRNHGELRSASVSLHERRARFLAFQVEDRSLRITHLLGSVQHLQEDLRHRQKLLDAMDGHCRAKDLVIEELRRTAGGKNGDTNVVAP